jgi:nitric oxide reductase subunit B
VPLVLKTYCLAPIIEAVCPESVWLIQPDEARWARIEKYAKTAFFGTNIGLAMMVTFSLFPSGVLQVWDRVQHGYWHAHSLDCIGSGRAHLVEWLRLPGALDFIIFARFRW